MIIVILSKTSVFVCVGGGVFKNSEHKHIKFEENYKK